MNPNQVCSGNPPSPGNRFVGRLIVGMAVIFAAFVLATSLTQAPRVRAEAATPSAPVLGTWQVYTTSSTIDLQEVEMLNDHYGWAVGVGSNGNGVTLRWDGSTWTNVSNPFTTTIRDVSILSENSVWVVGGLHDRQVIGRWNGSSWAIMTNPAPRALYGVHALSETDVWAVGWPKTTAPAATTALHWNGSNWTNYPINTSEAWAKGLYDVKMRTSTDGWIVGDTIGRWNGSSVQEVTPLPTGICHLKAVEILSDTDAWTAGCNNSVYRWNGTIWQSVAVPASTSVEGLSMTDANNGWAVAGYGKIIHWDGTSWQEVASPALGSNLYGIDMVSFFDGWAVGGGRILRYHVPIASRVYLPVVSRNYGQ